MDIQINYDYRKDELEKLPLHELTLFVLAREGRPDNTEVSISFVTDEAIAELNERYRRKEGPTDVLSFECDGAEDDLSAMTLAESPVYELGDVVIAPDVAGRQTREFDTTFEEEISLLLVHGLLHLCGYDHIEDDEAEVMEAREADILREWARR
ncbi:rRNA maturation RNase YbeY [Rubneribacter sp.]|nr:rRNA maturation RNase YbeY [Candidatus Rubneribacter avistercoris]